MNLLWVSQLRYLLGRPWLLAMAVLGVAVGVAGVLSISLTVDSSRKAFRHTTEALGGRATHVLEGGTAGLPEALLVDLARTPGVHAAPVVEGLLATRDDRQIHLVGLDPFSEHGFRAQSLRLEQEGTLNVLSEANSIALTRQEAEHLQLALGSTLELANGARLKVASLLDPADPSLAQALRGLVLCDVATAQEVLGRPGLLSRIDVQIEPGAPALPERVGGYPLVPSGRRTRQLESMTSAFFLNLQALSMLSMLVGALLVYNTMHFLVVQRQPLWQRLRTLGLTRRELERQVLVESMTLGLAGSLLGLPLGWLLARVLLKMVARTINDLYYRLEVSQVSPSAGVLLFCLGLGLATTALASLLAGRALAGSAPRQQFARSQVERTSRDVAARAGLVGLGLLLTGQAAMLIPSAPLPVCLGGVFLGLAGLALLTPALALGLHRLLVALLAGALSPSWRMSLRSLERSLSRTGVALAALSLALSSTVAVGEMVASFRLSLDDWLEQTLAADLYVTFRDRSVLVAGKSLPQGVLEEIMRQPEVDQVSVLRIAEVELNGRENTALSAMDLPERAHRSYAPADWMAFARGGLLISQPLQSKTGLQLGSPVVLRSGTHEWQTTVVGVFRDYASEHGYAILDRKVYAQAFQDPLLTGVGLYLKDPGRLAEVQRQVEERCSRLPGRAFLSIHSNREIKETSKVVFDRTFQVTGVLRWLAVLVAATATISALSALHIEKRREIAVWEALGLDRAARARHLAVQIGLLGAWAGVLAIPYGVLQSWWMTAVINPRAFGWHIPLVLDWGMLLQAPLLSLAASLSALPFVLRVVGRPGLCERLREE